MRWYSWSCCSYVFILDLLFSDLSPRAPTRFDNVSIACYFHSNSGWRIFIYNGVVHKDPLIIITLCFRLDEIAFVPAQKCLQMPVYCAVYCRKHRYVAEKEAFTQRCVRAPDNGAVLLCCCVTWLCDGFYGLHAQFPCKMYFFFLSQRFRKLTVSQKTTRYVLYTPIFLHAYCCMYLCVFQLLLHARWLLKNDSSFKSLLPLYCFCHLLRLSFPFLLLLIHSHLLCGIHTFSRILSFAVIMELCLYELSGQRFKYKRVT